MAQNSLQLTILPILMFLFTCSSENMIDWQLEKMHRNYTDSLLIVRIKYDIFKMFRPIQS